MALVRPRARAQAGMSDPPGRGLGRAKITVKGAAATAVQRRVITGILSKADELGASRRVMVACIMAATQESTCMPLGYGDAAGPDSRGPFQQRTPWGPLSQRLDPAGSCELFLTVDKGYGVQGWRVVHGSLRNAPGDLSRAINQVQHSAYPDAYAQWQPEAERTVDVWQGSPTAGDQTADRDTRYTFTREAGQSSWDAIGDLAGEVAWSRWAYANTLFYASDEELRRQQPSVTIRGGEQWISAGPRLRMSVARPAEELELVVIADRWVVPPGACVEVLTGGPMDGRWLVAGVAGESLDDPTCTITMRRPRHPLLEPPNPKAAKVAAVATTMGKGKGINALMAACKELSDAAAGYLLGAGHGVAIATVDPKNKFDCSSSTSWVLAKAGMFTAKSAIVSGDFASSWGEPGRGRRFTVWANGSHVWTEFHGPVEWRRFDTSPQGDTHGRGPRLRTTQRSTAGFTPRHWPGV